MALRFCARSIILINKVKSGQILCLNVGPGILRTGGISRNYSNFSSLSRPHIYYNKWSSLHSRFFRTFASQHPLFQKILIDSSRLPNQPKSSILAQVEESAKDKGEDAKGKEQADAEEKKKKESAVRALKWTLIAFGTMFASSALYIFFAFGAPLTDKHGHVMNDEFTHLPFFQQYWSRSLNEVEQYITYVTEPSRQKLLPDPLKPPYVQPPYTVLIELTGVLVYPDWTYKTGWRFKKRPGVDYFLQQIGTQFQYEIVIYTAEQGFTAFPIIDALDSQSVVAYRLFRDSTKYTNGIHEKDLDRINRDLNKVIVIDCNENAVKNHRNNAIVLPKWKGNDDDRTLFDLAALLQTISSSEIDDVKVVLEYYASFQDPISEFRVKQRQFLEQEKEKREKAMASQTSVINVLSPSSILNYFRLTK